MTWEIRPLGVGQNAAAADVFGEAFVETPQWKWIIDDREARETVLPMFFRALIDHAASVGRVHVAGTERFGFGGAAVWLPSDKLDVPRWRGIRAFPTIARALSPAELRQFGSRGPQLDRAARAAHPKAPHRYLAGVAVAPTVQGVGLGASLLEHGLKLVDARHEAAYLECSEDLIDYYQGFGFQVLDPITVGEDASVQYGMWRVGSPRR